MTPLSDFEIGTTLGNMINVEELTVPLCHPRATIPLPSSPTQLGSGLVRGLGWLQCFWEWDFLEQDEYNQLRVYCPHPEPSAKVFIRTKGDDGTFDDYSATMVWPGNPTREQNVFTGNLVLEFRELIVQ